MSTEFKYQASVKDADGDMVNVRADSAEELEAYLTAFPAGAYAQFKANVRGGQALGAIVQPAQTTPPQMAAPQQQQQQAAAPWPSQPPQQQAPRPQQGGGGGNFGGRPHPEGKQCQCGQVLEVKQTGSGKTVFRCPQWRWNNGNPTTHHDSEWA